MSESRFSLAMNKLTPTIFLIISKFLTIEVKALWGGFIRF